MKKTPKQERSKGLVEAIITGGIRILKEGNFDALTTSKISQVSGVSVGSFYQYFKNKESVVTAVIEKIVDDNVREILSKIDEVHDQTYEEMAVQLVDHLVDLFHKKKSSIRPLLENAAGLGGVKIEHRARKVLQRKLAGILTERGFRPVGTSLDSFVFILINSVAGVLHGHALESETGITRDEVKIELRRLVTGYMSKIDVA